MQKGGRYLGWAGGGGMTKDGLPPPVCRCGGVSNFYRERRTRPGCVHAVGNTHTQSSPVLLREPCDETARNL